MQKRYHSRLEEIAQLKNTLKTISEIQTEAGQMDEPYLKCTADKVLKTTKLGGEEWQKTYLG